MDVLVARMSLTLIGMWQKNTVLFLFDMVICELTIREPQNMNLWKQCN